MRLARSAVTEAQAKALRLRDVFTTANSAADFQSSDAGVSTPQLDVQKITSTTQIECTQDFNLATGKSFKLNGVALQNTIAEATELVHVDSSYGAGSSDGSVLKPYASLSNAITAKLVEGATISFLFKLMPGVYSGAISKTMNTASQSFAIRGSGTDTTFIQAGADFAAGRTNNVLFFRRFNDVELSDVTVRFGAYGFYPRDIRKCVVRNVRFVNLGSDGTTNRHDFSGTQAEQAAFWASTSTRDGGACRLRDAAVVEVSNCQVDFCLRGLRIQDCGSTDQASIVTNCRVYRVQEAGIYLAAGTYNGASGCKNFMVSSNTVFECFNNGMLCIGGQGNTFQGNNVVRSANAGFQGYSVLDTRCIGNSFYDCNSKEYNGIGNLGDAYGCIVLAGGANSAIGTGSHAGVLQNNTMVKCNQGRAAAIYGIHIQVAAGTYPTASDKVILDANNSDATVRVHNPNSIPEIATQAAASGGATTVVQMTDVSSAGSGAIITTVERALISTNQTNIAAKQDALSFGLVTETGKTCLSQNIKSYVDASGGSGLTTLTITAEIRLGIRK